MQSRLIPFTVAGTICFITSFILGASFWYFFGTQPRAGAGNIAAVPTANRNSTENIAAAPNTAANVNATNASADSNGAPPVAEIKTAPAGEINVTGGVVMLGGGETNLPLTRVGVADFAIGETEVTNQQYQEFVKAADHKPPPGWTNGNFLPGTGDEPVTGVTWADANDYCAWLSKEIGATVRLPSEAEWVRAARGDTNNKYPWGSDWNDEAAQTVESKGKIRSVKSLSAGRSPFGAYEMVGNVWEWTSDPATDEFQKPILYENSKQRIIKGGSVREERKYLTIDARAPRPENKASEWLGFRYVVIRRR